jgi:hypothetical protein
MHPNLSDRRHIVDQSERHLGVLEAIISRVTDPDHVAGNLFLEE